jgi:uncharacterized FlgJ-related protein
MSGEAASAYVTNLNTHPAYAAFRVERAAMRDRGESLDGYRLIGTLLRYSELGHNMSGSSPGDEGRQAHRFRQGQLSAH